MRPGELDRCLREAVAAGASDLHLSPGSPPMVRVDGGLTPMEGPVLCIEGATRLISSALTEEQAGVLERDLELDFAYSLPEGGRFRVNAYFARGAPGAVFRSIPAGVPGLRELGLPDIVERLTGLPRGLVLVTGPTGSGKSTTLAAMVDGINRALPRHIVTVEDPIEYLHASRRSLVTQREVERDTRSFSRALRQALRQDPDVILVGEMRDLETISLAVTAAETGQLVLATLHTQDAPQTVDRVIDVFPPQQQRQIRAQLANVLQAVVCQALVPLAGGGRAVACEILAATPAVRNMIRDDKNHHIPSAIQTGGEWGMQTMNTALARLVRDGRVEVEEATRHSGDPDELRRLIREAPSRPRAALRASSAF